MPPRHKMDLADEAVSALRSTFRKFFASRPVGPRPVAPFSQDHRSMKHIIRVSLPTAQKVIITIWRSDGSLFHSALERKKLVYEAAATITRTYLREYAVGPQDKQVDIGPLVHAGLKTAEPAKTLSHDIRQRYQELYDR